MLTGRSGDCNPVVSGAAVGNADFVLPAAAPYSAWERRQMEEALSERRICRRCGASCYAPSKLCTCGAERTPAEEATTAHRVATLHHFCEVAAEHALFHKWRYTAQGFFAGFVLCLALSAAYLGHLDREARWPLPVPPPSASDIARVSAERDARLSYLGQNIHAWAKNPDGAPPEFRRIAWREYWVTHPHESLAAGLAAGRSQ